MPVISLLATPLPSPMFLENVMQGLRMLKIEIAVPLNISLTFRRKLTQAITAAIEKEAPNWNC